MDDADGELDRLLRMADPGPGPQATALIGVLGRGVVEATPVRRRWIRRRWGVASAVGVVAAMLTATTAVAAYNAVIKAHTGQYGKPGNTENDTSEWLRTDGADYRQVIEELRPAELPVPPGFSYAANIDVYVANTTKEPAVVQVTGIRSTYAYWAFCAWEREWLRADAAGDTARRATATAVIQQVPAWPLIVATAGGGTLEHLRSLADAAANADADPVSRDVAINCGPEPSEGPR